MNLSPSRIRSEIKFGYLLLQKVLTLKEKKVIRRKHKTKNMTKIEVVTVETQMMYGSGSPWTSSHGKLDIFLSRQYVAKGGKVDFSVVLLFNE